jgi:hypothetical protein
MTSVTSSDMSQSYGVPRWRFLPRLGEWRHASGWDLLGNRGSSLLSARNENVHYLVRSSALLHLTTVWRVEWVTPHNQRNVASMVSPIPPG